MNEENNDDKSLIVKSNNLIEARYKLSLAEEKFILKIMSLINKEDEDFKTYTLSVNDFKNLFGEKNGRLHSDIKKITRELIGRVFTIYTKNEKGKPKEIQIAWFSSAIYEEGNVTIRFDPNLKPFLLQLKDRFTAYTLGNVIKLNSLFSIRMYELLKQYLAIGHREMTIEELRKILKIENEYNPYGNLKLKVLEKSKSEINKNTDIHFEYDEIKQGRKVVKLKFYIYENVAAETTVDSEDTSLINYVVSLFKGNIDSLNALKILKAGNYDLDYIRQKYMMMQRKKDVVDHVGWLISALKKDYKEKGFVKSEGDRHYTPEELEEIARRSREK